MKSDSTSTWDLKDNDIDIEVILRELQFLGDIKRFVFMVLMRNE